MPILLCLGFLLPSFPSLLDISCYEFLILQYYFLDIVKSFMKNRSGTYGDTKKTLPLEGGGKRVGVKGLTGIAKALRKQTTYPSP